MPTYSIYSQANFRDRVLEEWRRAERSGRPEILILFRGFAPGTDINRLLDRLISTFRETDVFGWYTTGSVFGVILVELGKSDTPHALSSVSNKIQAHLLGEAEHANGCPLSAEMQVLPPYTFTGSAFESNGETVETLWKDLHEPQWMIKAATRTLDIVGSSLLLLLSSPLLLTVTLWLRLTTPGPAYFRQERVGYRGRWFQLYKFRSMKPDNDDGVHRAFMKRFIGGHAEQYPDDHGRPVYKLTLDDRVTSVGRLLRRTSLDELPQLWNVLRGDMSLVGPRPPLAYEVECYDLWHRRRVYETKPGLTGLWQVSGRSQSTFDEMARLDLRHVNEKSLALYFKVLLQTPRAVIQGHGAH